MSRLLGIDYGTRHIGVALSDDGGRFAFPHTTITNNADTTKTLKNIIARERVHAIVVGESRDYQGAPNKIMKAISAFKESLERETHIPVFFEPEFLTSAEAMRTVRDRRGKDARAAAIILQSFIDKQQTQNHGPD